MWAAGCIVLATPLPMVATRTALVAHTPRLFSSALTLVSALSHYLFFGINYQKKMGL